MDAPVTRRELHESLETWAGAIIEKVTEQVAAKVTDQVAAKVTDQVAAKVTDQVAAKVTEQVAAKVSQRVTVDVTAGFITILDHRIDKLGTELREEMRSIVKTSETYMLGRMEAMLDPHRTIPERVEQLEAHSLPERVRRLEAKAFAPKRRATAARRKRS